MNDQILLEKFTLNLEKLTVDINAIEPRIARQFPSIRP